MASTGPQPSLKRRDSLVTREDDQLILTPLGAGNEVGRSCMYMSYKGKTVLFDCGIHPAYSGMAALPYFDEIDPSTIDVLLITHFHLDHAASLPYFLEKTTFKGRVFMTYPTKAIYKLLLTDYVKVSKVSVEDMLYNEQDINRSMDKIEVIDFHQTVEVNGIRFWCYTAGHVLGAAMFMVDIAGVRVLYTGDYSREEDRHLRAAETPQFSPDICIIESTYGVQQHQPRNVREKRFTDVIHSTISEGGRVLIPAFALGRAQELLLILDEYWSNHPELQNIPIYYASPLAKRCLSVYETYIHSMNDRLRAQHAAKSNPFVFKYISPIKSIENFKDVGPSVVMASPGTLQSGLSRQLFDMWCSDRKNACVLPGYVVEGTIAKTIITEPKEVTLMNGLTAPLNMQVHYVSFSAHADSAQTSAFLEELLPNNIILVHGEANEMAKSLQKKKKLTLTHTEENRRTTKMEATKTIAHEIGGIQNDALRFGLHGVKSDIVGSHPLESAYQSAMKTQEEMNRKILANTYGSAFPLKMDLDKQILSRFQRPPGAISSSMLGLEALTGSLDEFGFEDYLNDPKDSETLRPLDMHHGMEVRLGLSKGPICPSFI